MKNFTTKATALFLLLVLSTTVLCSCNDDVTTTVSTDVAVPFVINVDGKNITVENPAKQTIKQLLKKANIKINDGDIVSVDTDSLISQGIIVNILRKCEVTVKDEINNTECTVILVGATVKEAIAAAKVDLPENYSVNYKLNTALEDDMKIIISEKEEPETTNNNEETTNRNNNYYTPSAPTPATTRPTTTQPTTTTKPPVTTPPTTKPPVPTTSGRTVVSVEVYEDCDGSGHGVKVITYSDGTQEEVPF